LRHFAAALLKQLYRRHPVLLAATRPQAHRRAMQSGQVQHAALAAHQLWSVKARHQVYEATRIRIAAHRDTQAGAGGIAALASSHLHRALGLGLVVDVDDGL
jgi:hypothetical protein